MSIEEALKDAMSHEVTDVRAPAGMAAAVRGRRRRRRNRLRMAGAALVTAAVAVTATVALDLRRPPPRGSDTAAAVANLLAVPNVVGALPDDGWERLEKAGFRVRMVEVEAETPSKKVLGQVPAGGTLLAPGATVTIQIRSWGPTTMPPEKGDLAQGGRTFAGIRWDYLPEGLKWDGFYVGDPAGTSDSTSWDVPDGSGFYGVQVFVIRGKGVEELRKQATDYGEDVMRKLDVRDGKEAYLGTTDDVPREGHTREIFWFESPDLAVRVALSPALTGRSGFDSDAELKKIVERAVVVG